MPIKTALLSVSDKTGLSRSRSALAAARRAHSLERRHGEGAREEGVPVETVESYTGSPEVMDGRVKTLHPRVHGGILSRGETRQGRPGAHRRADDRPRRA